MIQKLVDWLRVRPSWPELALLVCAFLVFKFAWSLGVALLLPSGMARGLHQGFAVQQKDIVPLISFVAVRALSEEVIFRFLPLAAVLGDPTPDRRVRIVLAVVGVSAVAFALVHMGNYDMTQMAPRERVLAALRTFALQGVGGVLSGIVFLKACGLAREHALRGLFAAYALHVAWNLCLLSPFLVR